MSETKSKPQVHRWVFWPAAIIVVVFASFAIIVPDTAQALFAGIQGAIVGYFNWYYVLLATSLVLFCLWLGFGRFGDIKLGKDDDEPEFSLGSWFSLLFAAGMGIGLVFYGVSEPLSHFASPKPGVTGTPSDLAQAALSQTFLHWGVHAWSIYVVIGLALAYAIHRRGRPVSIRWTLEPLLGRRVRGGVGNLIDVVALVGTIFGVATSLGLGVLQISAGLESAGLITSSMAIDLVIIIVVTAFVLVSVLSGVGKGMKWLSNTNLILAGAFLVFLLVVGPTEFLLRNFVQSTGNYLQSFFGMAFNVSAFSGDAGEAWQSNWTTFYWGWWISWAPFVGIFIARISKGRTVRQFVAGVILVPTLITLLWFSVLGGTALYSQLNGPGGLVGPDGTVDTAGALFSTLAQLPAGSVLTVGAIIMIVIFFITSADSGALVMGMLASGGEVEPKNWLRIFFTLATSLLASALLLSGGLEALKTAAIIIALPFSVVLIMVCWATYRAFSRESRAYDKAKRMAFVDHIGDFYGLEVEAPNEDSPLLNLRQLTARLRGRIPVRHPYRIDPFGHRHQASDAGTPPIAKDSAPEAPDADPQA
ncbi:BCCT family transporter [Paeniglutamicibacter cryotolerans]|uniref:Choline/glycine/proline betaine transport protein n=1 Tax=Paeniglutamicibacter cryotolerans TaxID=670079 RepID=A0A839QML8_9MICC|nr:BCCT family transporter [Paeniglutamicibacter cryotolerans]MBB2995246.1 choline/glycine/proline betaine transport protein [Paeniglutamicibacter cryotolerans]